MDIELKKIKVKDLFAGYENNNEDGVVGFGGKLNIRPAYQREFVYKEKQRDAVIDTVRKNFPLNTMYWVDNGDGTYEVLDGQQRTISICEYIQNKFSLKSMESNNRTKATYFHNLTEEEGSQILDYELMIYFCKGSEREKLDWFKIINIAGEKLTDQELRNAVYTGTWLYEAKKYFSKTGCPASGIASKYINGSPIRQDFLETAIFWHSDKRYDKPNIEEYMAEHQHQDNASSLWLYFQSVISWVEVTFTEYRKEMKGVPWGILFNKYGNKSLVISELESITSKLMEDKDVKNKKGIYEYLLSGDERHLSLRLFDEKQKREAYERQKGICPITKKHYPIEEMEADHIIPWKQGGKTDDDNCQMLEKMANRTKSSK